MNTHYKCKLWLRHLISSKILWYKMWFYTIRKFRGDQVRLPAAGDDFYFDGYPRSGNTFLSELLRNVYPNREFASHLHSISGLKIALQLGLPIFVVVRNPKDAVVSNLYRKAVGKNKPFNPDLLEMLIINYFQYYSFVKEHITDINILSFDSCIHNQLLLIKEIPKRIGFHSKSDASLQESLSNYETMMKNKESQKKSHASSLPNSDRIAFKKEYLNKVIMSSSYNLAENIYKKLCDYDMLEKINVKNDC